MSRLNKVMKQTEKAGSKKMGLTRPEAKTNRTVPVYDISGKTVTPEKKKRDKKIAITLLTVTGILSFLYLPQFFMPDAQTVSDNVKVKYDTTSINKSNTVLKNNPDEDFDNDGIVNSEEITQKTSPYFIDSDGDSLTDYCEMYVTKTNPVNPDVDYLIDQQKKQDNAKQKKMAYPYRVGNVILWADNYTSKAYGSIVKTVGGYRSCNFSGYAQFPSDEGKYAYKVENGVRTLLPYLEDENAWEIGRDDTIELYDKKLDTVIDFSFAGIHFYSDDNMATDIINYILPRKGLIASQRKTTLDVEPDTRKTTETTIKKPDYNSNSNARFKQNSNTLTDLQNVRETIKEDNACVAVSLFSPDNGEYLAVAYGYTYEGDLLLADMKSLEPVGTLKITERAVKIMNEDGNLVSYPFFNFSGFGFDSTKGDRISFFATSSKNSAVKFNADSKSDSKKKAENTDSKTSDKDKEKAAEKKDNSSNENNTEETSSEELSEQENQETEDNTSIGENAEPQSAIIDPSSADTPPSP